MNKTPKMSKTSKKMKKMICLLFLAVAIAGIAALLISEGECAYWFLVCRQIMGTIDPKDALIERLAYAYRPPVRFGGEMILYFPKQDETIRSEIRAKGREIIPYLVKGLAHPNERIRYECAELLGDIPAKEGIEGLIKAMGDSGPCVIPTTPLHTSLHRLTGHGKLLGPGDTLRPDIHLMRKMWIPWWEKHKDRLINTDDGSIGLKSDDGTIIKIGVNYPDWFD